MNICGFRTLFELIRKELAQFRRDRLMMVIILVSPVMQLIILGLAASFELNDMPLAIYDEDRSEASRFLAEKFFHGEEFVRVHTPQHAQEIPQMLDRGIAGAVLVIPRGFSTDLLSDGRPQLQLLIDGSESTSAALAVRAATQIAGGALAQARESRSPLEATRTTPALSTDIRVLYNRSLESPPFFVPGILALVLMLITMLLTSIAIVKEKENGTLEQLIVSPLRPSQIILGKLVPYAAIGFFDMLVVLAVAVIVFGVVPAGSVPLLLALSLIFILTTLGLGLFVSTISATQQEAMMTAIFFIMMPMMFLSGFVFPIENMPTAVQWLTYLLPLRYYFTIIRGIFLRGVGIETLYPQALALLGFGSAILTISILRFRKRLD